MAGSRQRTFLKRQRERDRQQKQKEKAERKREVKARKAETPRIEGAEDPDIAGILPGPQPLPAQWEGLGEVESAIADLQRFLSLATTEYETSRAMGRLEKLRKTALPDSAATD